MTKVYIESTNIISSLGFTTDENVNNVLNEISGVQVCSNLEIANEPLPISIIDNQKFKNKLSFIADIDNYTRFEQLSILSIKTALDNSKVDVTDKRTVIILSTTKGNIELLHKSNLGKFDDDRVNLWRTAEVVAHYFKSPNTPIVISNACISGINAIVVAKRLICSDLYDNAIVVGADLVTKFVVSGFQSFLSLSAELCKPFDIDRNGLNIGEGAATIILSRNEGIINSPMIEIVDGAVNNDANHISGPSRTGEGLLLAIKNTIGTNREIDFISAHGTATPYNDDMESKAISRAGLESVPVNSLKGYFGHTLGAAGVIETVVCLEAMKRNVLIKTKGYSNFGVAEQITISDKTEKRELKTLLKVASGFGGCNAAALFVKHG